MKRTLTLLALAFCSTAFSQNTIQTFDILPGQYGSSPSNLTAFNGKLYFYASDENLNQQVWSTDGINTPIKTIITGKTTNNNFMPNYKRRMAVLGNKLYFTGKDLQDTIRIYTIDGTTLSSIKLKSSFYGPSLFTPLKSQLYFVYNGGTPLSEIYRLNPADNSITRVTGISGQAGVGFYEMVEFNGKLMISGYDNNSGYYKLFEYNPTNNTTITIDSSTSKTWGPNKNIFTKLVVENGLLYYNDDSYFKMYAGSNIPRFILRMDIPHIDGDFMLNNGTIFYTGTSGLTGNTSLSWKNTINEQNKQLKDINGSNIDGIVKFGKYLSSNVFITQGTYTYNNTNIWLLNGTNTPTSLSNTFDLIASPTELVEFKGSLYFITSDGINGEELSKYTNASLNTENINNPTLSATIYPNPVKDVANITLELKAQEEISITITNMQGRIVYSLPAKTYTAQKHVIQLSIQSLPSGIYNFAINNSNAVQMANGKIVKE